MNLCGISPIPILITFLCCACLFVYFNLRLAEIKNAVEKQNKVLTAFISNVQQDIRGGGNDEMYGQCQPMMNNNDSYLASPEAMNVVQKIEVSDDEYESDSDSDSDSDGDGDEEEHPVQKINLNDVVQLTQMGMEMENGDSSVSVLAFEVLSTGDVEQHNESASATTSSISEITDETLSLDATSSVSTITTQSYESMKVDDLRTTVATKNLVSKEDAKKLKKPELLALLKK